MSSSHFTIRAGVFIVLLIVAKPLLAQEKSQHPCFEELQGTQATMHRLPDNSYYWLAEDAVFIISPEERCVFLHLNTDQEREQFIEQFWYRRTVNPDAPNEDFKIEHYRRIAFANQNYGSGLVGWKTDRGRTYVMLGPPDSVDLSEDRVAPAASAESAEAQIHRTEKWHYYQIKAIGDNVEFQFTYDARYADYLFSDSDRMLLSQAAPDSSLFQNPRDKVELCIIAGRPPEIRSKDLEALLTSRTFRHDVKFTQRVEFASATHATTLVRVDVQIVCEECKRDSDVVSSPTYPLLLRVSKPSGWVVDTQETTASIVEVEGPGSGFVPTAHLDVPLGPGTYQLAIVAKKSATGEAGVVLTRLDVPTFESLAMKK